ncbi:ER membrane protein complex subunit 4 [Danaus plexippus]|uniref:ER membrane protein complex subunit 4 n=1 Tax=Danaus plexippus plexippus TaxID=278856 RepID=A0A212EN29_DANPL|nr:ER membrane protein complex subunit 4 [Danaus plexippus]OWR42886.1 transmembrane protein 85 [Danaus plexippus plexippus]
MSQVKSNKKFKWALDFNPKNKSQTSEILSPPGYSQSTSVSNAESSKDTDSNLLLIKKLWDVALGPLKQVPMNLFIMYMAGNSISIFPIMMVGMLIVRPVKALFSTQGTFKMVEGTQAAGQKFVYIIGNIVNILLALYKCQSMGLLPTHSSDWLAFEEPILKAEHIGGGFSML